MNKLLIRNIVITMIIVVLINIITIPVLFSDKSIGMTIALEGLILIIALYVGSHISNMESIDECEIENKGRVAMTVLSIIFIACNTAIIISLYNNNQLNINWLLNLTPITAILVSIKAALTEEIIFRYCMFSLLVMYINKKLDYKKSLIISALISSIAFALLLHGGSPISFLGGLLLAYIYHKENIYIAMLVHFLADLIPFLYIGIYNCI